MRIYVICPVRNADPEVTNLVKAHVSKLEQEGHNVYWPPRDAPQADPTGSAICWTHWRAMEMCDRVDVFWDVSSFGSHFDLGMAYGFGKSLRLVHLCVPDTMSKSYVKVMRGWPWND